MGGRGLDTAEHFQPEAGRDPQRVAAGVIVLAPALRDLQVAAAAPPMRLAAQDEHGIGQVLGDLQGEGLLGDGGHLVRQHRCQLLALQPLQQLLQQLAVVALMPGAIAAVGERGGHRPQERDAVDEDALRAHRGRGLQQQAVRRQQLLAQHLGASEEELQLVLLLQRLQVPAEVGGVADELLRRHLETHDHPRLIVAGNATVDEFHAEQGLAGALAAPSTRSTLPSRTPFRKTASRPAMPVGIRSLAAMCVSFPRGPVARPPAAILSVCAGALGRLERLPGGGSCRNCWATRTRSARWVVRGWSRRTPRRAGSPARR